MGGSAPVLLIQIRPATVAVHDTACFLEALQLPQSAVTICDAYCGQFPEDVSMYRAVMIGGSHESVPSYTASAQPPAWFSALMSFVRHVRHTSVPFLGVCFGMQLVAAALGGRVERDEANAEFGTFSITLTPKGARDPLFAGLPASFDVQQGHRDHVTGAPPDSVVLATGALGYIQAFRMRTGFYGIQFHPECTATRQHERLNLQTSAFGMPAETASAIRKHIRDAPFNIEPLRRFLAFTGTT